MRASKASRRTGLLARLLHLVTHRHLAVGGTLGVLAITLTATEEARAQEHTFYLDRAQISGAPDDGFMVWRPYMFERTRFYGNLALGYTLNPLRTTTVTDNGNVQNQMEDPVQHQLITYLQVGTEIASRVGFNVALPIAVFQAGGDDGTRFGVGNGTDLKTAAIHDLRLDLRLRAWENDTRTLRAGVSVGAWLPVGNTRSFTGDGSTAWGVLGAFEWQPGDFLLTANLGPQFRPYNGIGGERGVLRLSDELRYAVGGFYTLRDGKLRIGAELWGSTGLTNDRDGRRTFLRGRNTDVEWLGQVRYPLGERQRMYANFGAGTRLAEAYGSPDVRVLVSFGAFATLSDLPPSSPAQRRVSEDVVDREPDRDGDGFPDSIDKCPDDPEDGKEPDPTDGCPIPPDRDGDGIPDHLDKCPDQPEDFDNIQDADGCPEEDADNDGVPDVEDRCPGEPGPKNRDPKKNGCPSLTRVTEDGAVELLENIQFDTGKATIKPVSFPILDEVLTLMEARPEYRIGVYGHTDNRGTPALNLKLSKDRAASVVRYLVSKGIAASRLESEGYGQERPIDTNDTDSGRSKNRRVEFKILSGAD